MPLRGLGLFLGVALFALLAWAQQLNAPEIASRHLQQLIRHHQQAATPWLAQPAGQAPANSLRFVFQDGHLAEWSAAVPWPLSPGATEKIISPAHAPPQYWLARAEGQDVHALAFPLPGYAHYSAVPTPFALQGANGEPLAYLSPSSPLPPDWQRWIVALSLLSGLWLFIWADQTSLWLKRSKWATCFAPAVLAGAAAFYLLPVANNLPSLPFVHGLLNTPLGPGRLAHLPLLAILALWWLSLAQRLAPDGLHLPTSHTVRLIGSTGLYLSIAIGLLFLGGLFRLLLHSTALPFDFNNVMSLSPLELTALGSMALLLIALLLYSLWAVRGVHRMQLGRNARLSSLIGAIALSAPFAWLFPGLGLLTSLLICTAFIALIDLFAELDAGSPAWLILWLALLSAYAAGLLFKSGLDRGSQERAAFARAIASPIDSLAEQSLARLQDTLEHHTWEENTLSHFSYLSKNYSPRLLSGQEQALIWGEPPHPGPKGILPANSQYFTYGLKLAGTDTLLAFRPRLQQERRVLRSLIPSAPAMANDYPLSIYLGPTLIAQRGYFLKPWLEQELWAEPGQTRETISSQRANLYFHAARGYRVVVGENLGGYLKPLSLFSYLFALLTLLSLLLFGAGQIVEWLPATPSSLLLGAPSLRHRIQLAVIGLILLAFLLIAAVTVASLQQSSLEYQQEQLLNKVDVLLRDLQASGADLRDGQVLQKFADVHQSDLSTFAPSGHMLATANPSLLEEGLQSPLLNPQALEAFRLQGFKPAVLSEQAGPIAFLAAYVPIRQQGAQLDYFLQVPFAAATRNLQRSVLDFLSNLLNLYVFLLLIAGALAILVANSITSPLNRIGEKLRSFRLGAHEPLEWDKNDEIGRLVAAYNTMSRQLEESAERLKKSEREGAWREMAKQVAHEIKNPLTPMKLSIQYLQHAQKADPERAAALIGRVAETLIEQIDGLARIATEFSNFAKMPQARPEHFDLNELAARAFQLYHEHEAPEARMELIIPERATPVFADRGHLQRVLNNLIKNALQAIPDDRDGLIVLRLETTAGQAVIAVSDNGAGIPEEIQAKVFQPNFTTKSSGMGLGLAMCQNMVQAAGGDISFTTSPGEGTTFRVTIPLENQTTT